MGLTSLKSANVPEMWLRGMMFALLFLSAPVCAAVQPNILIVYLDDFGWKDAGYMGSDFYETPHIDALARQGMVFTDAYSCAANCAPARACLLSGQYTPRHRIFNVGTRARGNAKHRRLLHSPGTSVLRDDIVTWAELLQSAGYRTGMFGKWHLGSDPKSQGFDVTIERSDLPGFNGHYGPDGQYLSDVLTDRAIEFIETNVDGSWCVYLSHHAVHTPLQAKQELLPKYQAKEPGKLHHHAVMATMIQAVDDALGRLMAVLEKLRIQRNTVVIFYSDNGGYGPATDMDPLWGYKGTYSEGGIRVPLFVTWPGVVPPGTECSEPVIGVDLYPTLCEMAGAETPSQPLDGRSLLPLLRQQPQSFADRPIFWHFPAYLESYSVRGEQRDPLFRTRPVSAIRWGDFKLINYFEDGHVALYNLRDDIREQNNLAATLPDVRTKLSQALQTWWQDVNAPVPSEPNPEFDAAAQQRAIERALAPQREN